jgi:hypothetical protein
MVEHQRKERYDGIFAVIDDVRLVDIRGVYVSVHVDDPGFRDWARLEK